MFDRTVMLVCITLYTSVNGALKTTSKNILLNICKVPHFGINPLYKDDNVSEWVDKISVERLSRVELLRVSLSATDCLHS